MRRPVLTRRYVRVCNVCAERWTVVGREAAPAPLAARRPPRAPGRGGPGPEPSAWSDPFAAALEAWEAYRRCPRCGIDDFTQSRLRSHTGPRP